LEQRPDQQGQPAESKTQLVEQINLLSAFGRLLSRPGFVARRSRRIPQRCGAVGTGKARPRMVASAMPKPTVLSPKARNCSRSRSPPKRFSCCAKPTTWIKTMLSPAPFWPMPWSSRRIPWWKPIGGSRDAGQAGARLEPFASHGQNHPQPYPRPQKSEPVEDWVSQARKLQSSGDLFAALSRVEEGLDVYPNDPKLLQTQDAIQRDQNLRRRQARRRDLEDLRRMELKSMRPRMMPQRKILADRIQAVAANIGPMEKSFPSPTVCCSGWDWSLRRVQPRRRAAPSSFTSRPAALRSPPAPIPARFRRARLRQARFCRARLRPTRSPPPGNASVGISPHSKAVVQHCAAGQQCSAPATPPEPKLPRHQQPSFPPPSLPHPRPKLHPSSRPKRPRGRLHNADPRRRRRDNPGRSRSLLLRAKTSGSAGSEDLRSRWSSRLCPPSSLPPALPRPQFPAPGSQRRRSRTNDSRTVFAARFARFFRRRRRKVTRSAYDQPPAESGHDPGHAPCRCRSRRRKSFSQRKTSTATHSRRPVAPAESRTQGLRCTSLQERLSGCSPTEDSHSQGRAGQACLQPPTATQDLSLASLTIQGGAPGTTVLVDQTLVGTIQPDGTLSVSTVNPGDHTVELRKEGFKPRQFKRHFVVGGTISLAAADAALEAASGELKITFAPPTPKLQS
jgi:hypothetical protein